jgi:hypothetical protein
MVSVSSYSDSMCMGSSAPIGPYSSSYWCMMNQEFGALKVYGKASRQCSAQQVNVTLVQIDSYANPGCGGDVQSMETLPVDTCLATMSGSFKLSEGTGPSRSIVYTTYSDNYCSIQTYLTTFPVSDAKSVVGGVSMCTIPATPGYLNGIKVYIVNKIAAAPPGVVIEHIYPSSVSTTGCTSGNDDIVMTRYLRAGGCVVGSYGQYAKATCGSDPSKLF